MSTQSNQGLSSSILVDIESLLEPLKVSARESREYVQEELNIITAMESCHRTYNYDRSRCIFRWLSHVLSDYEKRSYLEHIARLDDLR